MKRWLLGLVLLLSVTFGCTATQQQYALQSALLASDVQSLSYTYSQVKYHLNAKQTESNIFTKEEWDKLLDVDASVKLLLLKYETIVKLDTTNFNVYDVALMWNITKTSYTKAREVVIAHKADCDVNSSLLFESFDLQADITSEKIEKAIKDSQIREGYEPCFNNSEFFDPSEIHCKYVYACKFCSWCNKVCTKLIEIEPTPKTKKKTGRPKKI